jgi:hypothetical protein
MAGVQIEVGVLMYLFSEYFNSIAPTTSCPLSSRTLIPRRKEEHETDRSSAISNIQDEERQNCYVSVMELLLTSVISSNVMQESGMNNPHSESTVIFGLNVQENRKKMIDL